VFFPQPSSGRSHVLGDPFFRKTDLPPPSLARQYRSARGHYPPSLKLPVRLRFHPHFLCRFPSHNLICILFCFLFISLIVSPSPTSTLFWKPSPLHPPFFVLRVQKSSNDFFPLTCFQPWSTVTVMGLLRFCPFAGTILPHCFLFFLWRLPNSYKWGHSSIRSSDVIPPPPELPSY